MKDRGGFTLVEVMAAAMIAGILILSAFSCFRMGYKVLYERQNRETINMVGDGIFDMAADELRTAGAIFLSDEEAAVPADRRKWNMIRGDMFSLDEEVILYAEADGENRITLTVRLERNGEICYERTDTFVTLNAKEIYGDGGLIIWYQDVKK